MKNKKKRKRISVKRWLTELVFGAVILIIVFLISSNDDMTRTEHELMSSVTYIKEQCDNYNNLNYASETKSLMRMVESARHVAVTMDNEESWMGVTMPDEQRIQEYIEDNYLTGLIILDGDGSVLVQSDNDAEDVSDKEKWEKEVLSEALLNVKTYKMKTYTTRFECGDGSYIDLAACGRGNNDEVIVAYYYTPADYAGRFNLSFDMLLSGYTLEKDGTIVITKGNQIVASNDHTLTGKSVDDIPVLKRINNSGDNGKLHHAKMNDSFVGQNFGLLDRGRDYYVYAYMKERDVFQDTPRNLLYVLIVFVFTVGVIHTIRWRMAQDYQKEQLKMQEQYAEKLRSQNMKLEKAVRQETKANSAKTNFLSRMTHDIRTPLNGIIGLLKIDEAHPDDQELIRANREKMLISANHLLSLINDMLQMSKLENGEVVLAHEAMNLQSLSSDILTIVEQRAADAGVTLEYDRSLDRVRFPYVYGSPLHVRQIFLNIYSNCIKYNKVGGKVETTMECLGMESGKVTYRWTIADTGIGMSPEFLTRLFEPFAQERTDARSVYNGTGLGMPIVKSLIEKMDGSIDVTSVQGEGSTFIVTIPFDVAAEAEIAAEKIQKDWSVEGRRLLLAEDNELNAEIAQMLLGDEGAEVVIARNGQEAIDLFAAEPAWGFDAILMDIMMPLVDGYSATKAIRSMERADAGKIPIIAMTANAFEEDAMKCYEAGMDAHLSKPLQMEKVVETIARCCEEI